MVHKKIRGRPRKDDASRETGRQELIDAAVVILGEGGSPALTARSVAQRAGTAVGSVYTQFDSLEALRLEANAVTMRVLGRVLAQAVATSRNLSTADRLLCLADAYLAFADDHHNQWAAMFERRTIDAPAAIMADIDALFAILEDVLGDAEPRPDDVPTMARALWSSVHGMIYLAEIGGLGPIHRSDIRPLIDALVRAAVRGFSVARPGATLGQEHGRLGASARLRAPGSLP